MHAPLAGRAAGWASASPVSGRKPGCRYFPGCGPMRLFIPLLCVALSSPALGQTAGTPAAAVPSAASGAPQGSQAGGAASGAGKAPSPEWRDTSAYRFPSLTRSVTDLQNLAHAMRLRDYCADARVQDEFVRERLARFSAITGREETCRTLLDY